MDRFYADKIYLQVCTACFPSVVTLSLLDLIFLYLLCNLILLDLAAVLAFTYFSRFPPCIFNRPTGSRHRSPYITISIERLPLPTSAHLCHFFQYAFCHSSENDQLKHLMIKLTGFTLVLLRGIAPDQTVGCCVVTIHLGRENATAFVHRFLHFNN